MIADFWIPDTWLDEIADSAQQQAAMPQSLRV
jgi:hypothetical protein